MAHLHVPTTGEGLQRTKMGEAESFGATLQARTYSKEEGLSRLPTNLWTSCKAPSEVRSSRQVWTLHVDRTGPFETLGERGYRYLLIMAQRVQRDTH
eukprot:2834691-Prorocentrum_lima.AAC.1